ncbi:MAG: phosphoribosylformylglycinamidine synthase subunit PurL [Anaerolineaceae bacterium]|nr:phosphoribosylformylglycinamidine synthase subunit PurL [Anaerolineaceae bacterium]
MTGTPLQSPVYKFICEDHRPDNPRSKGYLGDAHALGFTQVNHIQCKDLYFVKGDISEQDQIRLANELLSDPISQRISCQKYLPPIDKNIEPKKIDTWIVEVTLLPGVTDDVAYQIKRASSVLGIEDIENVCTGLQFKITGKDLSEEIINSLIKRLLCNVVIQCASIGFIEPTFPDFPSASDQVEIIHLLTADNEELLEISKVRRAALDLAEMQAIQAYFQHEKRDPTDVEFEMIAQTWSEHCVHKTFSAKVIVQESDGSTNTIDNLLKTYLKSATDTINAEWVLSAFVDNAGIISLNDDYEVSFKVETHNHPSAIEPFGGANTGIGGVIRDVIGVSAKPIAATDILCFGPQDKPMETLAEGVLHPRRIQSGVVAGIEDYGNKIGIPTVNGAVLYDEGYTANPLVYCGCVGLAPRGSHPSSPLPGHKIVALGGATGRDGLRGATFSSMTMDAKTGEVAGASVQIGAPIVEKGLIDVIMRARDEKLYTAITDCGAGGFSSAIGEMVKHHGANIQLEKAPLKYPGLAPWEIWLSEAQERMVLAVPDENMADIIKICHLYEVNYTILGEFSSDKMLNITYNEKSVLNISMSFLHDGIPQRNLSAIVSQKSSENVLYANKNGSSDIEATLLSLLNHPNIASKEAIVRVYDHEIQGGTAIKPLVGVYADGPSDASVIKPIGTQSAAAVVLSNGINPWYGELDAYKMAYAVIDEAIRNAVAVGANPQKIAILDNFCWGDPTNPQTMGSLVQALRGCFDAAIYFGSPFISGKDSLNNEYIGNDGKKHAIPPSLLISAIGVIDNVNKTITMDLKSTGNLIYLIGQHQNSYGGSHFTKVTGIEPNNDVPQVFSFANDIYKNIFDQIQAGTILACHDLSEGGLAVTIAEMCIAGDFGANILVPDRAIDEFLFSETTSSFLVEIKPGNANAFEKAFMNLPFQLIGSVQLDRQLCFNNAFKQTIADIPLDDIRSAWLGSEK